MIQFLKIWRRAFAPLRFWDGGGGGDTQVIQKSDPWPAQQEQLKFGFDQARERFAAPGPEFFPRATFIRPNQLETQAQNQALANARYTMPGLIGSTNQALQFGLGPVLSPESNPYLAQTAEAAMRPVEESLMERILPSIRSGAMQAGQLGGDRQGIVENQAIRDAVREMSDRTAGIYSTAYGQGLDAQGRALALAPQTIPLNLAPSAIQADVGAQRRSVDQAALDEEMARWNFEQQLPEAKLDKFMGLIQGNFGGNNMTSSMAGSDPLGGALGGAMLGYGIPGMAGALGGLGLGGMGPASPGVLGSLATMNPLLLGLGGALLGGLFGSR